jgi:hypothetical protein
MVFFNSKANESGSEFLIVGRQWWLFPAITIPLTILVFAIWAAWRKYRIRVDGQRLGVDNVTEVVGAHPTWENFPQSAHLTPMQAAMPVPLR